MSTRTGVSLEHYVTAFVDGKAVVLIHNRTKTRA